MLSVSCYKPRYADLYSRAADGPVLPGEFHKREASHPPKITMGKVSTRPPTLTILEGRSGFRKSHQIFSVINNRAQTKAFTNETPGDHHSVKSPPIIDIAIPTAMVPYWSFGESRKLCFNSPSIASQIALSSISSGLLSLNNLFQLSRDVAIKNNDKP